uniref:dUTP diphosphatase n=1 Tax=viral metagenome TaxID=1070528 RepID=A0A6C0CS42_9ZZZZ
MSYKVFLKHSDAVFPTSATYGSAGYDLSSCVEDVVPAHKWKAIETGIIVQFPSDCYIRVAPRSGLAFKKGLDVFAGVVDSDYTGTIKVILMNNGDEDFIVKKGDRIAQMIYERIYKPTLEIVSSMADLEETIRGAGGFGSTGV